VKTNLKTFPKYSDDSNFAIGAENWRIDFEAELREMIETNTVLLRKNPIKNKLIKEILGEEEQEK
jgi:hypothetical protein